MTNRHRRRTIHHAVLTRARTALVPLTVALLVVGLSPLGANAAPSPAVPAPAVPAPAVPAPAAPAPAAPAPATPAVAAAAAPTSVTIAGSLQSELGCSGDWAPDCAATDLTYNANDGIWEGAFTVPVGNWEYKAALNHSWDESYGDPHSSDGNVQFTVAADTPQPIHFFYDNTSHWITDDVRTPIVTAAGDFQSELGCSADWAPDCLRSWLQDPDGDGIYTFTTTALPAGTYNTKATIGRSWDINYGAGGAPGGANIPFTVPADGAQMTFRYDSSTHILTITGPTSAHDNNVEWDGLRHDSRDTLYRTPGGAVTAGTLVTLRLRTWADDVTGVTLRLYNAGTGTQSLLPMSIEASGVDCYDPATPVGRSCDFWSITLPDRAPATLWYRFIVTDGTSTAYYADDTPALDGGLGAPSATALDYSWALTVSPKSADKTNWLTNAVIYQVFPDRFRNGSVKNDPQTGDTRYDDPVLKTAWGTLPEGYCRNYAGATADTCPYRFIANPPAGTEQPTGRDYEGGDLLGVDQKLGYLKDLGVNTIYLNPIFDSGSDHGYDTQNYLSIDPYFGTLADFQKLARDAHSRGMKIILDGVFNHVSSDSVYFDRYHHYSTVGACESVNSPYRNWFTFTPQANGPCAGPDGPNTMTYANWAGFDTLAVLNKSNPDVQKFFLTGPNAVAKYWLKQGADGWRLDVMSDPSFPDGYWQTFRTVVKQTKPSAVIISEAWQKDSSLLRLVRGDQADGTMNYRLRDAVIGLLAPQSFDPKGFPDSGSPITVTQFADRISSIMEDYPEQAQYSDMNLLDSHDTERALWTLTPAAETNAAKTAPAALAAGKTRLEIASMIQFSMPGAPTIYYGDEVGVTGDDDPDDRRAYPWTDQGGHPDTTLFKHYQTLAKVRANVPALRDGDLTVLSSNDTTGVVSIGRKDSNSAAILVVNTGTAAATATVPVAGYLPNGLTLTEAYRVGGTASGRHAVANGTVTVTIPALGAVWLTSTHADLRGPQAPSGLRVTAEGSTTLTVTWRPAGRASSYRVFVSPVSGGGYVAATATVRGTTATITGLQPARTYHVVVRAADRAGNLSGWSKEATGTPHYPIAQSLLVSPPSITQTISAVTPTPAVIGSITITGVTDASGQAAGVRAQLGFGPDGSAPTAATWTWADAAYSGDSGGADQYSATLLPAAIGAFDYAYRFSTTNGASWTYADLDGSTNGYSAAKAGSLTVQPSDDGTPPAVPTGLHVVTAGPAVVQLGWDAVSGDPTMYGYEVLRSSGGGAPAVLALVTDSGYTDTTVTTGATYSYQVRSVDQSFNRSAPSDPVTAVAEVRTVAVTFTVTVPASTDGTGLAPHIAGTLSALGTGLSDWDPTTNALTRVDATHWTITLSGPEGTQLQYKYALGDWNYVEKDDACGEIGNRLLTLTYGTGGTQAVADTVLKWRNVAPCGN